MPTSPEVLELIRENQQRGAKVLNLSEQKLTEIPVEVYQLTHLEELDLRLNKIQIIPESLRQLTQLRCLNICWNPIQQLADINGLTLEYDVFLAQRAHLTPAHIIGLRLESISDEIVNDLLTLPQLTSLGLGDSQLSTLPDSITRLSQLTYLYLGNNQLSTLSDSITRLSQLTSLDLSYNKLSTLPDSITRLSQLTSLRLYSNKLSTLPDSITRLSQLTSLDLSYNELSTLPDSITRLSQLTSLDLRGNRVSPLPESITCLSQLTSLDLRGNRVSMLPESITHLTQLTSLDLGGNQLSMLPESITRLTQLTSLDLSRNQLKIIPRDILQLTHLEDLGLYNNPIENPPAEIAYQGIQALREYFAALDEGAVKNTKAKLILVGNGRVGKTCISKALAGEPFSANEKSTHGIRVVPLQLPHAPDIDFQVWDFGGQDIYHATHRLFLSHRALYVLVWDSDTEQRARTSQLDGEFTLEYWLDNIAALSDNSPVLVVQNKVDDTPPLHLPQDKLTKSYQIKEFLKVSAKTGKGFEELKQQIAAQFQPDQPLYRMVGYDMPKTWLDLRDQLHDLSKKRHSITYKNYLKRCNTLEINATAARVLCRFLHETADILYFSDEPKLKDLIAINPRWIAEKIYDDENDNGVLNQQVKQQHGKFTRAHVRCQLATLSEAEQDNFIELLKKFELCFEVADPAEPDTFIAPQYLPTQRPETVNWEWQHLPHPTLIYQYQKPIHHSVMVRFIARFGHFAQQKIYWRDGILFKQAAATALVECHHAEHKITVHLKDDQTGQLALTIDENFSEINYYRDVELLVPCCCTDCEKTENFHRYEAKKLKEFVTEKHKTTVECPNSGQMVEIGKLVGAAMQHHWLYKDMVTAGSQIPVRTQPTEFEEEINEEVEMQPSEPAPSENNVWKIYREVKKVIFDEPVEFALDQLNVSIQKVPALGQVSAVGIGLATILFIINQFVPNTEALMYGAVLLFLLGVIATVAASFRPNTAQKKVISWAITGVIVAIIICITVFFLFKLFKSL